MDILIAGVGGQGTLLASRVLGRYALDNGLDCKLSEVHGMSQRGGSVITFVRLGKDIYSPIIEAGGADVVIAFEKLEALRYAHYLKKGGMMLYSVQEIMPMPVVTGACGYPDDIEQRLPENRFAVDALGLAEKAGNSKAANSVMIGAFTKIMKLDKDKMRENAFGVSQDSRSTALTGISIPSTVQEINDKAFEYGYAAEQ